MVPRLLEKGGTFLCSGIIDQRGDEVAAALEQAGLKLLQRKEKNGWIALAATI
jgi:ribosomal protein L11 methyltransferase